MEVTSLNVTLPPLGRCAYCSNPGPFTLEHIIPYGLGGYVKWPEASCGRCADITKRFEQRCLRDMFGPLRIHLGLRTRNKKERPTKLPAFIASEGGERRVDLEISDHPFVLSMPVLPPPRILSGQPLTNKLPEGISFIFRAINDGIAGPVTVKSIWPVSEFYRLLAKIGHCWAVAELGQRFTQFLPPLILGDEDHFAHLIGGTDVELPDPPSVDLLHDVKLTHRSRGEGDPEALIVACVTLFPSLGMPTYQVVVGRERGPVVATER